MVCCCAVLGPSIITTEHGWLLLNNRQSACVGQDNQHTKHTKIQHVTTTYIIIMCVDRKTIVCDSKQFEG